MPLRCCGAVGNWAWGPTARACQRCAKKSGNSQEGGGTPRSSCGQDINRQGFLTVYSAYDALDNLLQVNQAGLNARWFQYDSLSRLTMAFNPESGATLYSYDPNGNLSARTRPAPN